jgi:hypothetical protein
LAVRPIHDNHLEMLKTQWCSARHLRPRDKYIFTVLRQPRQYGMML